MPWERSFVRRLSGAGKVFPHQAQTFCEGCFAPFKVEVFFLICLNAITSIQVFAHPLQGERLN